MCPKCDKHHKCGVVLLYLHTYLAVRERGGHLLHSILVFPPYALHMKSICYQGCQHITNQRPIVGTYLMVN